MSNNYFFVDNQSLDLFRDDQTAILYEERSLLCAKSGDVVVTRCPIDAEYVNDLSTLSVDYNNIKLIPVGVKGNDLANSINDEDIELLRSTINGNFCLRSYIPDEDVANLSAKLDIPLVGKTFYMQNHRKSDLMRISYSIGLPIIGGLLVTDAIKQWNDVIAFFAIHNPVVVKPDNSLGGIGLQVIDSTEQLVWYVQNLHRRFIMQKYIESSFEGSVQYISLNDRRIILVCETYQKNFHYYGFTYKHGLRDEVSILNGAAKLLSYVDNGYGSDTDWFGIDFIINQNGIFFHDFNPRKTSVSYVLSLAAHVYPSFYMDGSFAVKSVYLPCKDKLSYREVTNLIRSHDLFFDKATKEGVVLVNPALLNMHTIQFVSFSRKGNEQEYLSELSNTMRDILADPCDV